MAFGLKLMKSAGVRVTIGVHRAIAKGNLARHDGRWPDAANAYRTVLTSDPSLYHIWLQLGHACKENGDVPRAREAYERAEALRPQSAEPSLHLAHLDKSEGNAPGAARRFADLLRTGEHVDEAMYELARLVRPIVDLPEAEIVAGLDLAGSRRETATVGLSPARPAPARTLVFDIGDLIGHFRHQRLPTGIQRVQIEVLAAALRAYGTDGIEICCMVDGRTGWIGLPADRFLRLAELASAGNDAGDPDWRAARAELFVHLAIDDPYEMPEDAVLVNLGTSWWIYDYFRMVREAKETRRIAYVAMVYDLIPILQPQYCVDGITADYSSWTVGVFDHADGFLAISESTKADLIAVARRLGHDLPSEKVTVIPLDADFRRVTVPLPDEALGRWGLDGAPFALFVSTIEARKNHVLAFDAWAELLRRHGSERVPRLVCVGRNGWLNDAAFGRLANDPDLRAHVSIIHQASDEELALLYRTCRFTLYPSHYEGWGLPVTESLSYGRVAVVADNSSLPEAAAGLCLLFEDGSLEACIAAVETVMLDEAWRTGQEARIAAEFRPRSWAAVGEQTVDAVVALAGPHGGRPVDRRVEPGRYYPAALYRGGRIWKGLGSGEIFRAGEGWLWPETDGCRTRPGGGELRMTLAGDGVVPMQLHLIVRGLDQAVCPYRISTRGQEIARGVLEPREQRWIVANLPAGRDLSLYIVGEATEIHEAHYGGTAKRLPASLSVLGFALVPRDDEDARLAFAAARTSGNLDEVSAYREQAAV